MRRSLYSSVAAAMVAFGIVCAAASVAQADDSVTPICNEQVCTTGWYAAPTTVTWQVSPTPQSTIDCAGVQPVSHDYVQTTTCEALWSGDDIKRSYTVRVELSSPTAAAATDRPPDSNGWFNHPVGVSFAGASFSGIASCTPAISYGGPSVLNAMASGTCTDNAGKTANASVPLNYDATPPTITGATASRKPDSNGYYTHPVTFTFKGTDSMSGIASCDTVTYRGPSSGSVVGGCHDRAGNYATRAVYVRYRAPTPLASVTPSKSSVRLRWRPAAHATYYNVQIFRSGKKVLSTWPTRSTLLIRRSWSFGRHRYALKPGLYRWYVWPGYGSRGAARYGRVLVSSTFQVTKPT